MASGHVDTTLRQCPSNDGDTFQGPESWRKGLKPVSTEINHTTKKESHTVISLSASLNLKEKKSLWKVATGEEARIKSQSRDKAQQMQKDFLTKAKTLTGSRSNVNILCRSSLKLKRHDSRSSSESAFARQVVKPGSLGSVRSRIPQLTISSNHILSSSYPALAAKHSLTYQAENSSPSSGVDKTIERALRAKLYLLQQLGPNSFLIGGEIPSNKYRVIIGTQTCTCGVKSATHCIHVLFVMLRVFQISVTNLILWKKPLLNYEVEALFRKFHERRLQKINDQKRKSSSSLSSLTSVEGNMTNRGASAADDVRTADASILGDVTRCSSDAHNVKLEFGSDESDEGKSEKEESDQEEEEEEKNECSICLLEMDEADNLAECKSGCQNRLHQMCIDIWFDECRRQKEALMCPLCRAAWASAVVESRNKPDDQHHSSPLVSNAIISSSEEAFSLSRIPAEHRSSAEIWVQAVGEEVVRRIFARSWTTREQALRQLEQNVVHELLSGGTDEDRAGVASARCVSIQSVLESASAIISLLALDPVYKVFVASLRTLRTVLSFIRCRGDDERRRLEDFIKPIICSLLFKCADPNRRTSGLSISALEELVKGQEGELAVGKEITDSASTVEIGGVDYLLNCIMDTDTSGDSSTQYQSLLGRLYMLDRLVAVNTSDFTIDSSAYHYSDSSSDENHSSSTVQQQRVYRILNYSITYFTFSHTKVSNMSRRVFYCTAKLQSHSAQVMQDICSLLETTDNTVRIHMCRKLFAAVAEYQSSVSQSQSKTCIDRNTGSVSPHMLPVSSEPPHAATSTQLNKDTQPVQTNINKDTQPVQTNINSSELDSETDHTQPMQTNINSSELDSDETDHTGCTATVDKLLEEKQALISVQDDVSRYCHSEESTGRSSAVDVDGLDGSFDSVDGPVVSETVVSETELDSVDGILAQSFSNSVNITQSSDSTFVAVNTNMAALTLTVDNAAFLPSTTSTSMPMQDLNQFMKDCAHSVDDLVADETAVNLVSRGPVVPVNESSELKTDSNSSSELSGESEMKSPSLEMSVSGTACQVESPSTAESTCMETDVNHSIKASVSSDTVIRRSCIDSAASNHCSNAVNEDCVNKVLIQYEPVCPDSQLNQCNPVKSDALLNCTGLIKLDGCEPLNQPVPVEPAYGANVESKMLNTFPDCVETLAAMVVSDETKVSQSQPGNKEDLLQSDGNITYTVKTSYDVVGSLSHDCDNVDNRAGESEVLKHKHTVPCENLDQSENSRKLTRRSSIPVNTLTKATRDASHESVSEDCGRGKILHITPKQHVVIKDLKPSETLSDVEGNKQQQQQQQESGFTAENKTCDVTVGQPTSSSNGAHASSSDGASTSVRRTASYETSVSDSSGIGSEASSEFSRSAICEKKEKICRENSSTRDGAAACREVSTSSSGCGLGSTASIESNLASCNEESCFSRPPSLVSLTQDFSDFDGFLSRADSEGDRNISFKTELAAVTPDTSPPSSANSTADNGECHCKEEVEREEAEALAVALERSTLAQDALPHVPGLSRDISEVTLSIHCQDDESPVEVLPHSSMDKQRYQENIHWKRGRVLGTGGFCCCYHARDIKTGTLMAVKQICYLRNTEEEQAKVIAAIIEEVHMMAKLNHPNILRILGATRHARHFFMFLEWMPGCSVAGLLETYGAFSDETVTSYTSQVLRGVAHLHEHQIVHRDIKGANLLVDSTGHRLRICDFGAAARLATRLTMAGELQGQFLGTIAFMAPEVLRGGHYGRSCDIWSIGCTVVQMVTTKPVWEADQVSNHLALIFKIASTITPPPIPENLTPAIRDLTLRCLEVNPDDRPSAKELLKHPLFTMSSVTRR